MCNNPKQANGFTMVELMITIAILGILMMMAVPSFDSMIRNNRLTTYANELVTAMNIARSESIKRGVQVTVRTKSATASVWEDGWQIFTDSNGNGTLDGTDALLREYGALATGYTLRSGERFDCWVAYTPTGISRASSGAGCAVGGLANDTFRVCDNTANATNGRAITLNAIGRARTIKGTASCP